MSFNENTDWAKLSPQGHAIAELFNRVENMENKMKKMLSMIDGAYEVVELHGYHSESPSVKQWAKDWLEMAKSFGASAW